MSDDAPLSEDEIEQIVQSALAEEEPDDRVPVMLLIHNGVVENDVPQFVPFRYMLPTDVLASLRGDLAKYEAVV